jgi:hypothetical protein
MTKTTPEIINPVLPRELDSLASSAEDRTGEVTGVGPADGGVEVAVAINEVIPEKSVILEKRPKQTSRTNQMDGIYARNVTQRLKRRRKTPPIKNLSSRSRYFFNATAKPSRMGRMVA